MSLIGGGGSGAGGAGNPVGGSNPAGTGSSINYIGNHVYAYSGPVATGNSLVTQLDFTTGNAYLILRWYPTYLENTNVNYRWIVSIDGQDIVNLSTESQYVINGPNGGYVDFIAPAFSRVTVKATNIEDSSTNEVGSVITGRVYA